MKHYMVIFSQHQSYIADSEEECRKLTEADSETPDVNKWVGRIEVFEMQNQMLGIETAIANTKRVKEEIGN